MAGVRESVKGRLLLLAGGQGKGQDFGPVQALLGSQIDHMYCFGQDAEVLLALGEQTERVADLDAAVAKAAPMPDPATGCCWRRPAPAWTNSSLSKRAVIVSPSWYKSYERPSRSRRLLAALAVAGAPCRAL